MLPKINSSHGSDTRNIINAAIDAINVQGKTIQDLVAEGQLTPTQYATLIQTVNGMVSKGGNEQISWGMVDQHFKEQVTGGSTAVVGVDSVNTSNIVDGAATSNKRTALGDMGVIYCDVNSFVDFDFENGRVVFNKEASSVKTIQVYYKGKIVTIGKNGVNDSVIFNKDSSIMHLLTVNEIGSLNVYTWNSVSQIDENEILLAVWKPQSHDTVFCNADNIRINGRERTQSIDRTPLGESGLLVLDSENLCDFDFVNKKIVIPSGSKKIVWRKELIDLPTEKIEIEMTMNTSSPYMGLFFDVSDNTFKAFRNNLQYRLNITETMLQIGGLVYSGSNSGSGFIYGHVVTNNGEVNIPQQQQPPQQPSPIPTEDGIYGIRYDINSPNPVTERVGNAIGLTAEISIDNSPVENDFDNIYPWSDMRICNLKETEWGATEVTYKSEQGFAFDGSNGNVFVEVPKHYMKRYREGDDEYILISGTPKDGFILDPAFVENGKELDKVYVGRYDAFVEEAASGKPIKMESKSNVYPRHKSISQFKDYIATHEKEGYSNLEWRTFMMLQRLFLVEFSTRNSQSIMGGFSRLVFAGKCHTKLTESATNRIIVEKNHESDKFKVGQTVSVSSGNNTNTADKRIITAINDYSETEYEIVFTGDPMDLTMGIENISHMPQINGQTDYINYPSGRTAGENMQSAFQYRGIENLWGNIWNAVDGIKINDLVFEFSNDMNNIFENKLSFKAPLMDNLGGLASPHVFAKKMGYDPINPNVMLPVEVGTETIGEDYWCDGFYSYEGNEYVPTVGGGWDHFDRGGLFAWRFWYEESNSAWGVLNGGRLMYKPL